MDVLRVPKIEFPDYPSCEHLWTMSKDELMTTFYECPSDWGERLFTLCKPFAKGLRFINMVMTFVLYPLQLILLHLSLISLWVISFKSLSL